MRITESQLRKIVRQTIIEENRKKVLQENVMQKLASRPMIMFSLIMSLAACTGKSISPEVAKPGPAQTKFVEDAVKDPLTIEELRKRIEDNPDYTPEQRAMLQSEIDNLEKIRNMRRGIEDAISPLDALNTRK